MSTKYPKKPPQFYVRVVEQITNLYKQGYETKEIATILGLSENQIRYRMKRYSKHSVGKIKEQARCIPKAFPIKKKHYERNLKIVKDMAKHRDAELIAEKYGLTPQFVNSVCRDYGMFQNDPNPHVQERNKEIFNLYFKDGLSMVQIAIALDLSTESIKTIIRREQIRRYGFRVIAEE